ncbi:MAG: peptide-methionine (R)-S-oxide reductase MsrB [Alphaproteobacteria bacterium]|nr:peptide-methionine (R)-S-oxide reductase MsrB [Alphaproteobacteria bacterium]MDE2109668.1 peptide-methionine (R)-S-oxide reductase MsrB [Alphaproteobacteria bacterium]MDE2492369.1 peptide-methionine (R)-S-oxide reductase MsrB [Alphaproteobacteria bacterium]
MAKQPDGKFSVAKSNDEWRAALSKEQYHVLREHGTEPVGTSALNHEKRQGSYVCAGCGAALFDSTHKYDSGSGWPSFTEPHKGAIGTSVDKSHFMVRTEIHCLNCGGHLGHVFADGPQPHGLRFCTNGAALIFKPDNS